MECSGNPVIDCVCVPVGIIAERVRDLAAPHQLILVSFPDVDDQRPFFKGRGSRGGTSYPDTSPPSAPSPSADAGVGSPELELLGCRPIVADKNVGIAVHSSQTRRGHLPFDSGNDPLMDEGCRIRQIGVGRPVLKGLELREINSFPVVRKDTHRRTAGQDHQAAENHQRQTIARSHLHASLSINRC